MIDKLISFVCLMIALFIVKDYTFPYDAMGLVVVYFSLFIPCLLVVEKGREYV